MTKRESGFARFLCLRRTSRHRHLHLRLRFFTLLFLFGIFILFFFGYLSPPPLPDQSFPRRLSSSGDQVIDVEKKSRAVSVDRNLWNTSWSQNYYGCSNTSKHFLSADMKTHPDRYLLISTSGGLNQQRTGITDAVVAAYILNATLVVPMLDQKSYWKDVRFVVASLETAILTCAFSREVKSGALPLDLIRYLMQ